MDALNYFILTLVNALKVLGPYALFFVGGYLIFIKMPFLFLKKSMDDQKKKLEAESKDIIKEKRYTVEDYQAFKDRLKLMNGFEQSDKKEQKKEEEKKNARPPQRPSKVSTGPTPEEILGLKNDEVFTKSELKKRYFELLKQNHPDRVASMGNDFKKLAEKNTKEIVAAYEKLKNKAA